MTLRNEYRVIQDSTLTANTMAKKKNDAIIIERTEDGVIFLWPLFPKHFDDTELLNGHQDLDNYSVDGIWLTSEPWTYFDRLDDVMPLLNRQQLPLEYIDLGWLPSIRDARARAIVVLSLK